MTKTTDTQENKKPNTVKSNPSTLRQMALESWEYSLDSFWFPYIFNFEPQIDFYTTNAPSLFDALSTRRLY